MTNNIKEIIIEKLKSGNYPHKVKNNYIFITPKDIDFYPHIDDLNTFQAEFYFGDFKPEIVTWPKINNYSGLNKLDFGKISYKLYEDLLTLKFRSSKILLNDNLLQRDKFPEKIIENINQINRDVTTEHLERLDLLIESLKLNKCLFMSNLFKLSKKQYLNIESGDDLLLYKLAFLFDKKGLDNNNYCSQNNEVIYRDNVSSNLNYFADKINRREKIPYSEILKFRSNLDISRKRLELMLV